MNHWAQIKTAVLQMPKCICVFITRQCLSSIKEKKKSHICHLKKIPHDSCEGEGKKSSFQRFHKNSHRLTIYFYFKTDTTTMLHVQHFIKIFTQHDDTVISFYWSTIATWLTPPPHHPASAESPIHMKAELGHMQWCRNGGSDRASAAPAHHETGW